MSDDFRVVGFFTRFRDFLRRASFFVESSDEEQLSPGNLNSFYRWWTNLTWTVTFDGVFAVLLHPG